MEIEKRYDGDELTMAVSGRIDTLTSDDLDKQIKDEEGNFNSLIMDFTDVEYISSAGLRILISTHKRLDADEIPFVITNVNDTINEIFRMSGFNKILKIE